MKKIICSLFCIIIMSTFVFHTKVFAADIELSKIKIEADVPEDFDRDIYVIFEYEDTTTGLFTLNLNNKYNIETIIQVGEAKVKEINIVGDIGQYKITAPQKLTIEKDKEVSCEIVVNEEKIAEKDIEKVKETDIREINDEKVKDINIENKEESKEKPTKEEKKVKEKSKSIKSKEDKDHIKNVKKRVIKSTFSTIIALVIVLAIYLIVKRKNEH